MVVVAAGFGLAALIALEVNQASRRPRLVPYAVLLPVAAAVLMWFGRTDLRVVGDERTKPSSGWAQPTCLSASSPVSRGAAFGEVRALGPNWTRPPSGASGLDRAMVLLVFDDADDRRPTGW